MSIFKKIWKLFFNRFFAQKLIAYLLLIGVFYLLGDFLFVLFLTFLFAYLFLTFGTFLKQKFDQWVKKWISKEKVQSWLLQFISLNTIVFFLYVAFIGAIFFALSDLLPQITSELKDLSRYIPALSEPISMVYTKLEEIKNINTQIWGSISEIFSKQDIDIILQFLEKIKTIGTVFLKVFLSLILSYILIIDRKPLGTFLQGMEESNFGFLYREYKIVIGKILKTFWAVFKAQSMIALANAFLTTFGIFIIGMIHQGSFPFIYTLAILVFICGFIPVLGTFLSSVPILLIGYSAFGGVGIVVEIVFLISIVHGIEAYYLNPKIVASYTKLPISVTFLILILSEHFIWFVGLVIGISVFYLLLDILRDADKIISQSKLTLQEFESVEKQTQREIKSSVRVSRKIDE